MEIKLDCSITVTEFGDLVLIEYCGNHWPPDRIEQIVICKRDYLKLTHRAKNPDPLKLMPENIPLKIRVNRYSERYLKYYYEGSWSPEGEFEWWLMPKRYLQRGDLRNFFLGDVGWDGFLRTLDDEIVVRKLNCEFWESHYNLLALAKELKKHKQFSDFEYEATPYYNIEIVGAHRLKVKYTPKVGELDERAKQVEYVDFEGSYGYVHDKPFIKKFKRKEEDLSYCPYEDSNW